MNTFGPKVVNIMAIDSILRECDDKRVESIGLTPWNHDDYKEEINIIENWRGEFPSVINLFHLNKNDFHDIYDYFAL